MFKKILNGGISLIFILCSGCEHTKGDPGKNNTDTPKEDIAKFRDNCHLPLQVQDFLKKNTGEWRKITIDEYNDELLNFLEESSKYSEPHCNYRIKGDFNNNGTEDLAIVLRNKEFSLSGYDSYQFPFLLIFNDFQSNSPPQIIFKTGAYKDDEIKSVIFSDPEHGILSYLEKSRVCNRDVVQINNFEKSSFLVYWDEKQEEYQYVNYLDYTKKVLCEIMNDVIVTSEGREVKNFSFYKDNEEYFTRTFDVNGDGLDDQIISSKPYMGDALIVFLGNGKDYEFSIKTINFSQDGGNIVRDITPTKNNVGFSLTTFFPDRGYYEEDYFIDLTDNDWVLNSITYKTTIFFDNSSGIQHCKVIQEISLNDPQILEKIKSIPNESERGKKCTIIK